MAITDPTVALAVINEAKAAGAYRHDTVPEDDATRIQVANECLKLAEDAQQGGLNHPGIAKVIAAASAQPGATPNANPFETAPAAAAPAPAPTPAPAVPAAAAPAGVTIDTAIPGYDKLNVNQILAAMESLNEAGIAFVKQYEEANDERGKILKFEKGGATPAPAAPAQAAPDFGTPAAAPAAPGALPVFATVGQEQYPTAEPWEGYKKATIKDIMAVIEAALNSYPEVKQLFGHVWAFESANNNRSSLLKKLKEIAANGIESAGQAVPTAPAAVPPTEAATDVVATSPFANAAPTPAAAPAESNPFEAAVAASNAVPAGAVAPVTPAPATATTEFSGAPAPLQGATQAAQAVFAKEFPKPDPQAMIPIPGTLNGVPDPQLDELAVKFNAIYARLISLHADAEGFSNDAKISADDLVDQYIVSKEWPAKITVKQIEAEASGISEIQVARHKQREWFEISRQYAAAIKYVDATVKMISRAQTRRDNERAAA